MTDAPAFAAHLAALARVPDPEDRAATRLLGAVVLDWTQLALTSDPRFELDGSTLWMGNTAVPLPAPWREALRGLEGALRAHGVGGVRLVGPVDRGAVLALLRGARALPPSAPRDELQRWVAGHGGAAVQLLPPRPAMAREPRGALLAAVRTWSAFAAASEGDRAALAGPLRALVERVESDARALPVVLAFAGPRPHRRGACVATLALLVGARLGLGRAGLADLATAALDAATLPPVVDADAVARLVERRVPGRLGRTDARSVATLWGLRPERSRHPHLFARIVALAEDFDATARGDGPRRAAPDEAVTRLQASHRHDAALVNLLVGAIGRWPVGTSVLLDTGEVAVVCRPPATHEQAARPVVRVVVDRTGALLAGGPLVDLAAPEKSRARVLASVDAERLGIDVARAVLG